MGRVLAGEFEGSKVKILDGYKCLCIKTKEGTRPIDSTRVKSYQMKEAIHNPFTTLDRTFLIQWKDGTKSIIALESAYVTLLVTGCEAVEVPEELPQKVKGGWLAFWLAFFIVGLVFFGIFRDVFSNSSEETEKTEKLTWSEWDGSAESPSTTSSVSVFIDPEFVGVEEYGDYYVMGKLRNNTNLSLSGVEIYFDVFDSTSAEKVNSCMARIGFVLNPERVWNYKAVCRMPWTESSTPVVSEVTGIRK